MFCELIIDGYNLLHLAGFMPRHKTAGGLEKARKKLLARLSRTLLPEELQKTTIVFDAQYVTDRDRQPYQSQGITMLFSPRGRQADDIIEEMLWCGPRGKQVTVISSDHRLQRAARAARAQFLDCDTFLVELDRREELMQPIEKPDQGSEENRPAENASLVNPNDIESWMVEFGNISVEELRQEAQQEHKLKDPLSPAKKGQPLPPEKECGEPFSQSLPERPDAGVLDEKPVKSAAAEQQSEAAQTEDLSFWEKRVAELLDEEKPRRPRRD
jgi:predicted RNA-binding protein with PIN domain